MPANRREPVSVPFWFQSKKCHPHGGFILIAMTIAVRKFQKRLD